MARLWPLDGPAEDVLSLKATAALFGYEVKTFRKLIAEGRFPRPRGFGQNEYYTGDDVAAIRLLLGRWQPDGADDGTAAAETDSPESAPNRHKSAPK